MEELVSKELKDLKSGDKLMMNRDSQVYSITEVVYQHDDENKFNEPEKYFYFQEIGSYVKDKVMKKMFRIKHDKFIIFNVG